jgi:hypothetical protein
MGRRFVKQTYLDDDEGIPILSPSSDILMRRVFEHSKQLADKLARIIPSSLYGGHVASRHGAEGCDRVGGLNDCDGMKPAQ